MPQKRWAQMADLFGVTSASSSGTPSHAALSVFQEDLGIDLGLPLEISKGRLCEGCEGVVRLQTGREKKQDRDAKYKFSRWCQQNFHKSRARLDEFQHIVLCNPLCRNGSSSPACGVQLLLSQRLSVLSKTSPPCHSSLARRFEKTQIA